MMKRTFALLILAGLAAASAWAQPPSTAHYVDRAAPCFRWPAVDMDGDGVFDRVDRCDNTQPGCTVDRWGCPSDSDGDGVCDGRDQCPDTPKGMKVDKDGCGPGQRNRESGAMPESPKEVTPPPPAPPAASKPVSESERQLLERGRIRLENVYFETASANLLPESEASLNEAGAALEKFADLRIEVEGHTDTRGSSRFNQSLSQARAEAVRDYLLKRFHLRAENYTARGYGETRPETKERNDEELLRNRRVELRVLNPEVLPRNVKVEGK